MTKVTVIEIDLGQSIDSIIMADISQITKANREDIDAAVASARLLQDVVDKRKKEAETKDLVMEKLYQALLTATANHSYLSSKEIIQISEGEIANMISFAGRMRGHLKTKGNEYRLIPCKRNKETAYVLEAFNGAPSTSDEPQDAQESPENAPTSDA